MAQTIVTDNFQPPATAGWRRWARHCTSPSGRIIVRIAALALILVCWQFLPGGRAVKFWASDPVAVFTTLCGWIADGSLWNHLGATLLTMSLGYVIGCVVGTGLGLMLGFFPYLHRILSPFIAAFYALPKIALAPLFIILLGIGLQAKVALVAITVFFLVLNATLEGVRNIDRDSLEALVLMGATRGEIISRMFIPAALPWIFTGMRISVRYAFTNTLLAELIATNSGLGFLIQYNSANFNSAGVYAAILILVAFSVVLTEILTRLERHVGRR
jgi:NitT/TauT family transport system permease protein